MHSGSGTVAHTANEWRHVRSASYAQNPLHTFPRNFPVDGEAANLLRTCYRETGVMHFGL